MYIIMTIGKYKYVDAYKHGLLRMIIIEEEWLIK
jgi:hypothetical protein